MAEKKKISARELFTRDHIREQQKFSILENRKKLDAMNESELGAELINKINTNELWNAKDMALSTVRGVNNFGRSMWNLGTAIVPGKQRRAHELGWKYNGSLGEPETPAGALTVGLTQFLLGFVGGQKLWKGLAKKLTKGKADKVAAGKGEKVKDITRGTAGASWHTTIKAVGQGAGFGALSDFVSFDPSEANMGNWFLKMSEERKWEKSSPQFHAFLKDYYATSAEDWEKHERTLTEEFS